MQEFRLTLYKTPLLSLIMIVIDINIKIDYDTNGVEDKLRRANMGLGKARGDKRLT